MATTILINKAGVNQEHLGRIIQASELPKGRLLLVCNDVPLGQDFLGICMPRGLARYAKAIIVSRPYKEKFIEILRREAAKSTARDPLLAETVQDSELLFS